MECGIKIEGSQPMDAKTLDSVTATVLAILAAPHCDEATKQLALKTLGKFGMPAADYRNISLNNNCIND